MNTLLIVIGVVAMIAGIGCAIGIAVYNNSLYESKNKKRFTIVPILIAVGLAAIILGNSFKIIPTGYSGVRTRFGQVNAAVVDKGFHWKTPFVEKIYLVNNKQQDITIGSTIWGETKEKTPIYATDVVITYQINENFSAWLYSNVTNLKSLIDDKLVASALKSAMVELDVETVTNRSYVEPLLADKLQKAVNEKYGENVIIIKNTVINNMDFEESYNLAIANKSIASQNKQRQEIENETAISKAEADKKVAIAVAEAEAETKRIAAEAEAEAILTRANAEAEANRKLAESLTEAIIKNKTIEKWDGGLPKVTGDSDPIIKID